MSLKIDRVQLEIVINNDQARKSLRALDDEFKQVTKELKKLKEGTVEYEQKSARLKSIKLQMDSIYQSIGITNMSMRELTRRQSELNAILVHLRPGAEEYKKLKAEVTAVSGRMNELRGRAQQTGDSLNNNNGILSKLRGGYFAAAGAVYSFIAGIKSVVSSYIEEEKALKKVEQAIKSTGAAAGLSLRDLKAEAENLQSNTIFGDETILNSVTAQLLTFTNIAGSTFLRAQRAALDLATVLDGDLQSASIMLGKALNDPIQGLTSLRRVGVSFTQDQQETIKELANTNRLVEAQAIILGELNRQYGGQAEAAAKGAGAFTVLENKISDVGEIMGKHLVSAFYPFANVIADITSQITKWISIPLSAELLKEQSQVNALTSALTGSNLTQKERNYYYTELMKIAPDVLKGIDAENISIGNLTRNLALYNQQMLNKILMQRQEEKIAEVLETQADAFENVTESTEKMMLSVNKVYGDMVVQGGNVKNFAINLKAMYESGRIGAEEYATSLFKLAEREKISLGNASTGAFALMNLSKAQKEYKEATENTLFLEKEKADFMQKNGIKTETEIKNVTKTVDSENEKQVTAFEKMKKAVEAARLKVQELVVSGDLDEAMKADVVADNLERALRYIEEIIASGGDLSKVLSRTPVSPLTPKTWIDTENASDAGTMVEKPDGTVNLGPDPSQYDKEFYLQQAQVATDAAFDIYRNAQDARFEREIDLLNRQMEVELNNKNLTEEQKDAIRQKYAAKEASIKQDQFRKQKAADIIQATINTALAVTKLLANPVLAVAAGIAGAAQIAVIAAQPTPQFAKGRYPVIGADDGRTYQADWTGKAQTRIYSRPSLVAEQGAELIVDASTTKNLMMNYPGIIEAIYAARVPQRATGNLQDIAVSPSFDAETVAVMREFTAELKKGVRGKWVLYDLEDAQDKLSKIKSNSTL